jgi:hypothetical protein
MNKDDGSLSPEEFGAIGAQAHFERQFLTALAILLVGVIVVLAINLAVGLIIHNHLDQDAVDATVYSADRFVPEQVERARYFSSLIAFPLVCLAGWLLSQRLKVSPSKLPPLLYPVLACTATLGIGLWLYFALRQTDFVYVRGFSWLTMIPSLILLAAIYVETHYSPRWLSLVSRVSAITIVLFLSLATVSFWLHNPHDTYFAGVHFNAYFYSLAQVSRGETLLVDLTNQYGFYPYFLQPIFKVVGMDVTRVTAVIGLLLVALFLTLFFLVHRLIKSRVIQMCAFLAIPGTQLWYLCRIDYDPYYQYWPHRLLLPVLLLLIVWFYQKASGRRKQILYGIGYAAAGISLLWNIETGVIAFGTWVLFLYWETLARWRSLRFKSTGTVLARHTLTALAVVLLAIASLSVYTLLRSGDFPALSSLLTYQSTYYGSGYFMLHMPLIHPWNLVILTYMVGLLICFGRLARRMAEGDPLGDQTQNSWYNMVFVLSIMGAGLFSNYQGRSHDYNLLPSFWSAFFLVALFADSLLQRIRHGFSSTTCWASRSATGLLALALALLLTLYASGILGIFPQLASRIQSQAADASDTAEYDVVSTGTFSPNRLHVDRYAATITGNLDSVKVKCSGSGSIKIALYGDVAGAPGPLLNSNQAKTAVKTGWNSIRLPSTYVTAGTYYWIAFNSSRFCVAYAPNSGGTALSRELSYSSSLPDEAGTGFDSSTVYHCLTGGWGNQGGTPQLLLGRAAFSYVESLSFIKEYFSPGDQVLILSLNQTAYYMDSGTTNPLPIPGFAEFILLKDKEAVVEYLLTGSVGTLQKDEPSGESGTSVRVVMGDDFQGFYPDLFQLVQDNYRVVDRVNDLTLCERVQE